MNKDIKKALLKVEILYSLKHRIQNSNKPIDRIFELTEKIDSQVEHIVNGIIKDENISMLRYIERELLNSPKDDWIGTMGEAIIRLEDE